MQKIVLFIEPIEDAYLTPFKIGNLFMNRFAVDEEAAFEILKIFELEKSSNERDPEHCIDDPYITDPSITDPYSEEEEKQRGMDLGKLQNLM